ncbi:hypothetical protein [Nesterenkonia marinintestina]|nr:hypothetical protein [Nesterenkonia sp. GX14115]
MHRPDDVGVRRLARATDAVRLGMANRRRGAGWLSVRLTALG